MKFPKLKKSIDKVKPILLKGASGAMHGYIFGSVIGLFNSKKNPKFSSIISDSNALGKKFCVVGALYSTTQAVLEEIRGKKTSNCIIASAISGSFAQRKSGSKSMATTAAAFTLYNGAYQMYGFK